jgi:hypothetical protein
MGSLQVGQANAERLNQPFDAEDMAAKLKESIECGNTAGLAVFRTWKDYVELTHDPPKGNNDDDDDDDKNNNNKNKNNNNKNNSNNSNSNNHNSDSNNNNKNKNNNNN